MIRVMKRFVVNILLFFTINDSVKFEVVQSWLSR